MLNKAVLVGRLVQDPALKSTQSGVSVLNFDVAIPRKYKDASGERQTDFIACVAFRQTAEFIANWFKKGNLISIDGSIQVRSWEDNNGNRRYATEVIVADAGFVESKKERETAESLPELPEEFGTDAQTSDDDLPF